MKFGLSDTALADICATLSHFKSVTKAEIFGSRVLGTYKNNSDIDLVLYGDIEELTLAKIVANLDELSIPYIFDVISYEEISHAGLKEHISKYAKLIYLRDG